MTAILELLGAPGAGKTTLTDALLNRATRPERPRLRHPDEMMGVPRVRAGRKVDGVLRELSGRLPARASGIARDALWRRSAPDFLSVLAREHMGFLDVVAHATPPQADPDYVLRWRQWPHATLEHHVLLRGIPETDCTVVVEEGLVMRANTVCAGDEALAARYFATQPLPDALVALKVRPEEALARLQGRGKKPLLRHQNRSEASILEDLRRTARLVDTAVDVLRGRGLDVLVLDATASLPANRRIVLDHLLATASGR